MRPPVRRLALGLALAVGLGTWLVSAPSARAQYPPAGGAGPPGFTYTPGFGLGVPYGINSGHGAGYAAPYGPYFTGPGSSPATSYYNSGYSVYTAPGRRPSRGRQAPPTPYNWFNPTAPSYTLPGYGAGYGVSLGSGPPLPVRFGYVPSASLFLGPP